jgi:hypothetical protein
MNGAPRPAIFVNENLDAPENRLNLALLALMPIYAFRVWFLRHLGLPEDCVVYPPEDRDGIRPDLVVVRTNDDVLAWIEIERGGENTAQLKNYRDRLSEPVLSIVGPNRDPNSPAHLSLKEVSEKLDSAFAEQFDNQHRVHADMFRRLAEDLVVSGRHYERVEPGAAIRDRPLFQALADRLGDRLQFSKEAVPIGVVQVSTMVEPGWTIRVFSNSSEEKSIRVIQNTAGRGPRVSSAEHLTTRLPPKAAEAIQALNEVCAALGADPRSVGGLATVAVPEQGLLAHVDRLAHILLELARAYQA